MSHLKTLSFSSQTRSQMLTDKKEHRRHKLITALNHQRSALEAHLKGQQYTIPVQKYVTHAETGERTRQDIQQRIKPWWWTNSAGKAFTHVKYGNRKLGFQKGQETVEAPNLDALLGVYATLADAAKAGELDAALEGVAFAQKR